MNKFNLFIIIIIIYIACDFPYLYYNFSDISTKVYNCGNKKSNRYYSAFLVYVLLALGVVTLVLSRSESPRDALYYGAIMGLVSYGVFDFTIHFMLEGYDLKMTIKDVIWGTILSAFVSWVAFNISKKW